MSTQPQVDRDVIPSSEIEQLREGREILRHESRALDEVARRLDTAFCAAVSRIEHCTGSVIVTGMGKAGLIGKKVAATFASLGTRATFLHPAEAVHGDLGLLRGDDVVLALSNSGETDELCRILPIIRRAGAVIIAITSKDTSTLGCEADVTITLGTLREAGPLGLAPTASTTAMLAVGDALALVVSQVRGFSREQFARFHPAGHLGLKLRTISEVMRRGRQLRIADETATVREVFASATKRLGPSVPPVRRTGAVMLVDAAGCLAGIFTDSDLARLLESHREQQLDRPISEVMTRHPKTISVSAPLPDAIDILSQFHISELPVIDDESQPVGLVDITDVIALMPEEREC
jgi:arabinose-5-phosphate isomerase